MTKLLRTLALLTAIALLAAACGNGASGDDDDTSGGDAAEADAQEGDEITVWIMQPGSDTIEDLLQGWTDDFAEETGTSVDLQFIPWPSAHDQFTTAIASGETPDVAEMGTTWTAEFGDVGVLATQDADLSDGYVEAVLESGMLEGEALGLPWYAGARGLLYRTDVFDELGLEVPTTWDEFIEVGEAIQEGTDMFAFAASPSNFSFLPLIWQNGGEIAEEVEPGVWESRMNSPESVEAHEWYADLLVGYEFAPSGALNWDAGDARSAFFNEEVAMHIGLGVDVSISVQENPDLDGNIGVALLPEGPSGNRDTFAGGSHLVVFEGSDAQGTAQAYAEYLLDPERISTFAEEVGFFPGTVDGIDAMDLDELDAVFAEMLVDHARTVPPHPAWGAFEGEALFINAMQEIMGGADAQEVLDGVAERMDSQFGD